MSITEDNHTYYRRAGSAKAQQIFDFVDRTTAISKIYDVGCNNGDISYRLQKELKKEVYGIDSSTNLKPPADYNFKVVDIVKDNGVYYNDFVLYLSLYHHLLGAYGIEVADDIFFKLLLTSKYLVFDTGNVSEKARAGHAWNVEQAKIFQTEEQLLDHFGLSYEKLGTWNTGGGSRNVVVYTSKDFDDSVKVTEQYRRYYGRKNQHKGLVPFSEIKEPIEINENCADENNIYYGAIFYKLELAGKTFFAKKHTINDYEEQEKDHITMVYNKVNPKKLIKYYGFSETYGFIYEWLDDFEYIGKTQYLLGKDSEKQLCHVDMIKVNGEIKHIDFQT